MRRLTPTSSLGTWCLRPGRLMDAGEVEARERELAIAIRSRLALIPLRLADRLGGNGNRLAIEQAAEAEISEALVALSEIGTYSA
jgi:hypothetical protein